MTALLPLLTTRASGKVAPLSSTAHCTSPGASWVPPPSVCTVVNWLPPDVAVWTVTLLSCWLPTSTPAWPAPSRLGTTDNETRLPLIWKVPSPLPSRRSTSP